MAFVTKIYDKDTDQRARQYALRYLSQIDPSVQKQHHANFETGIDSPQICWDDARNLVLLALHRVIAVPFRDHPAAYALFAPDGIVLFQSDEDGLHCDFQTKQAGVLYPVLPYELPVGLRSRDAEVRIWIIQALICLGHSKSNQFLTYNQVAVIFDQEYKPRNFETFW